MNRLESLQFAYEETKLIAPFLENMIISIIAFSIFLALWGFILAALRMDKRNDSTTNRIKGTKELKEDFNGGSKCYLKILENIMFMG